MPSSPWTSSSRRSVNTNSHRFLCGASLLAITVSAWSASCLPFAGILTTACLTATKSFLVRQHGRIKCVAFTVLAIAIGQIGINFNRIGEDGGRAILSALSATSCSCFVALLQCLSLEASSIINDDPGRPTGWWRSSAYGGSTMLVFPTLWTLARILISGMHLERYAIGSRVGVYPEWLPFLAVDFFLDAILGQGLGELLESIFFDHSTTVRSGRKMHKIQQDGVDCMSSSKDRQSNPLWFLRFSALVVFALYATDVAIHLSPATSKSKLQIGCAIPDGPMTTKSVLATIREDVIRGIDIILVPETSLYVDTVDNFLKFKKIVKAMVANDQATVVVPTQNFNREEGCHVRMEGRIHPIGERRAFNSYTTSFTPLGNKTLGVIHVKSLFLTWESKQVPRSEGRFLTACATCLEDDFPNVFSRTAEHITPDLVMIPSGSWSAVAAPNRIEAMKQLATRRRTNILFCGPDHSGYIDRTGNMISKSGTGRFSFQHDLRTSGKIRAQQSSWWILAPSVLISPKAISALFRSVSSRTRRIKNDSIL